LDSFKHKPDCFKSVAGRLKLKCGEDMPEWERVQAAIQFTLCELSTARIHSYPLECASFASLGDDIELDLQDTSAAGCVEAFSRSTQHWSSYSGYLREIRKYICLVVRAYGLTLKQRNCASHIVAGMILVCAQFREVHVHQLLKPNQIAQSLYITMRRWRKYHCFKSCVRGKARRWITRYQARLHGTGASQYAKDKF
ncbi:hypothetical protein DACRYDRAFT_54166, partial [Dacryopinax primogenitus]